jgi:hypothetical protein
MLRALVLTAYLMAKSNQDSKVPHVCGAKPGSIIEITRLGRPRVPRGSATGWQPGQSPPRCYTARSPSEVRKSCNNDKQPADERCGGVMWDGRSCSVRGWMFRSHVRVANRPVLVGASPRFEWVCLGPFCLFPPVAVRRKARCCAPNPSS